VDFKTLYLANGSSAIFMNTQMKVLMINPPIYDFSAYDLWMKPIGFLKIADLLVKNGIDVFYFDFLDRNNNFYKEKGIKDRKYGTGKFYSIKVEKPEIYKHIPREYKRFGLPDYLFFDFIKTIKKIDFIFITTGMTYWYLGVKEIVEFCKNYFPSVPIIIGGIYATFCFNHAKEKLNVDMVFKGKNIEDFIDQFNNKFSKKIKIFNNIYPYWDFYEKLKYVCIKTSYGCPFSCWYCGIKQLEPSFYQRDHFDVFFELKKNYEKFHFKDVAFYDDALFFNFETHLLKFLELVKKEKINVNFHTPNGIHPKFITKDVAVILKESNFKTIRLSLETISVEREKESSFKVSFSDFEKAIENLVIGGYSKEEIGVYILAGLPFQKYEEVIETIKLLKKYPCKINIAEYSPIPGTIDFEISKNLYPSLPIDEPLFQNNSIFPLWLSENKWEKIEKLKEIAHSE